MGLCRSRHCRPNSRPIDCRIEGRKFEAAAAAVGPSAPAAAIAVFEFVHDDLEDVGGDVRRIVGVDGDFRPGEGEALAVIGQFAVIIPHDEGGLERELGVAREQVCAVPRHHQKSAGGARTVLDGKR
jgi:hypothetical protein